MLVTGRHGTTVAVVTCVALARCRCRDNGGGRINSAPGRPPCHTSIAHRRGGPTNDGVSRLNEVQRLSRQEACGCKGACRTHQEFSHGRPVPLPGPLGDGRHCGWGGGGGVCTTTVVDGGGVVATTAVVAATVRRVVRRATPATETGDAGRPTMACAGAAPKKCTSGSSISVATRAPSARAARPMVWNLVISAPLLLRRGNFVDGWQLAYINPLLTDSGLEGECAGRKFGVGLPAADMGCILRCHAHSL